MSVIITYYFDNVKELTICSSIYSNFSHLTPCSAYC